ncbi:hypothetical protein [Marinicrinis lubricantis]|uniref:Uncharacterized protein n=1 Tax=Marinicrinis lubricantis TaxID=2086470 RepID=A0ABW1ILK0_9BACL
MKIIHAPTEIAGQMEILCQSLKKLEVTANGYNWFHNYLNFGDQLVKTDAYELAKMLDPLLQYCDIFHFHNGNSLYLQNKDLPLIHQAGKKMIMHHWGNDVRKAAMVSKLNPYPLPPSYLTDEQIHERLLYLSKYIEHAIVQDYETFPYVKDYYAQVHVLPLACHVERFPVRFPEEKVRIPKIIHAPTNQAFKGSEFVEKAINDLKKQYRFEYIRVEKMSHAEALQAYASADIIVDQILCGSYGMLSVEAMSMGKVVVAYIRDDVLKHNPVAPPIVNANPDNMKEVLSDLLKQPEQLRKIGKKSRAYVKKVHDAEMIARQLVQIYSKL